MRDYKRLDELGVPVHDEPIAHVFRADIDKALSEAKLSMTKFGELFGVQTCPVVEGGSAMYPWDAEAVIERMVSGNLTGTQAFWD